MNKVASNKTNVCYAQGVTNSGSSEPFQLVAPFALQIHGN